MIPTLPILELPKLEPISIVVKQEPPKPEPPKETEYIVKEGDNLTIIAEAHSSTIERLWQKNVDLTDPDKIEAGKRLIIPTATETLAERAFPVNIVSVAPTIADVPGGFFNVGNTYTYGYCTWYVKNVRPDMPNDLGNADTWYARYHGSKGSLPRAGAVGVAKGYMHVVYVTSVNGNTVTVSEMNYKGWNQVSTRTTSASEFNYIY